MSLYTVSRAMFCCLVLMASTFLAGCATREPDDDRNEIPAQLTIGRAVESDITDDTWIWHELRIARDDSDRAVGVLFVRRSKTGIKVGDVGRQDAGIQAQALLGLRDFRSLVAFVENRSEAPGENLEEPLAIWRTEGLTVALLEGSDGIYLSPLFGCEYFARHIDRKVFLGMARRVLEAAGES